MRILIGFDLDRMSDKRQLVGCHLPWDRQAKAYRTSQPALRARFLHTALRVR
jgi:hypothetical protein